MKQFALFAAAVALGVTLISGDAEAAKRLGGGKSMGMQRESVSAQKAAPATPPTAAPGQNPAAAPMAAKPQPAAAAPAAQAQPKRSWMGPLAGLAAGLGLAALASHFGFGEELASMLMIGLLVVGVLMVVGFIMRKRAEAQTPALAGAGAAGGAHGMQYSAGQVEPQSYAPQGGAAAPAPVAATAIPAGFDVEAFVRNAKVHFLRLQAANDAKNLEDVREFTTPEMFGEIKLAFMERGAEKQQTDVVMLNAEVLEVVEEGARYVVSVRFHGLIREAAEANADPFDEVWHLTKPCDGNQGWLLAGIQQVA